MTTSTSRGIGIRTAAGGDERLRGQLHVYDGEGKGKSQAALGVVLRTIGLGICEKKRTRVLLLRFLKGPGRTYAEDAAIEALQFLTSQDSQTKLYEDFGYTPTRQAVFRDLQLVAAHPELPELEAALANAVLRPLTPVYAQISDLLYRELSRVFTGRVSPERGMKQLQEQTLQLRRTVGGAI